MKKNIQILQKKIGFWSALAVLVGSVVGIGIFFRNGSVATAVEYNGVGWLLAWILGAIIALFTAISYSEIGSIISKKRFSGLSYWATKFGGSKFGYFVRFNFSFFNLPIIIVVLGFFISEFFFLFLSWSGVPGISLTSNPNALTTPIYIHVLFGTFLSILYIVINKISLKIVAIHQNIVTVLKFAPIILAIIIGLVFANKAGNSFPTNPSEAGNAFQNSNFNFGNVLKSLPSVLFAFDAFLIVGSLSNKVKGGSKTISKVVIIGMIFSAIIYILLTIASILHNAKSIGDLITSAISNDAAKAINIFLFLFIFISGIGVVNGITSAYVTEMENGSYLQTWFGAKFLVKKIGNYWTGVAFTAISYVFWWLIFVIPALIMNSDELFDAATNFVTIFFFGIYAIIVLLYLLKRKEYDSTKKVNKYLFYIASWTSIIGITITVFAQYVVGIQDAIELGSNSAGLGVFVKTNSIKNIDYIIMNFIFLSIFFLLPTINFFLIKFFEKRNAFIIQKEEFENSEIFIANNEENNQLKSKKKFFFIKNK
ncbi:APC family permease [[Mycoplasma] mobile]|uniref:Putative amino acid permease n=1 Tax=Mycoplasma mobile (strain ATCC 43663 / 163K / NCTC 11711) TaxID=267748 RepID=Q6KIH6_MYCM1|nr:amino acid permease [[Mycoplasma] mobile]AAT27600.1 putative amino acid permease [Mycoplasma mobile 163K]